MLRVVADNFVSTQRAICRQSAHKATARHSPAVIRSVRLLLQLQLLVNGVYGSGASDSASRGRTDCGAPDNTKQRRLQRYYAYTANESA